MLRTSVFALLCLPLLAQADAFKCIDRAGRLSFASVPCPAAEGDALRDRKTVPGHWVSVNEEDAKPHNINQRALRVLQSSYRTRITYKVNYLDGPAPPRTPHPVPRLTPIRCTPVGGVLSCEKAR